MKKSLHIAVPAGIGDVSWILSKLVHVSGQVDLYFQVADGAPYRTVPFLKLFPWIKGAEYGKFNYNDLFLNYEGQGFKTWKDIIESGYGMVSLTNNLHLEMGYRLEDWLPDLPTDFHYDVPETRLGKVRTDHIIEACKKKFGRFLDMRLYGISAASYRGAQSWNTWEYEEWAYFLTKWHEYDPKVRFVLMGGGWDDLTRSLYEELDEICFDTVGKTSFATALSLHRRLDGYVGFSSGLGIMRTVLGKKTFMLWPSFQEKLSTSWAPPEMIEDGSYKAVIWGDPDKIFDELRIWLKE